jgi:hypothetical protein
MKSLTVRLPERLVAAIEAESRIRCISKSDVVRSRLEAPDASIPASITWARVHPMLEKAWAASVPKSPRTFLSPKKQKLAALIRAKKLHR